VIPDGMPCDLIQSQGHGSPKVVKMAYFEVPLLASMHVIKRPMLNYDTPRQYLNFNQTDF